MTTFEVNGGISQAPAPVLYKLDCALRRERDPVRREQIVSLMRFIRNGISGNFLERQAAIVENRKPRYRVRAQGEVAA